MSIQTEMQEIREFDKSLKEFDVLVSERITQLNAKFDDWVFTRKDRTDKIDANRIGDLFGKPIEV